MRTLLPLALLGPLLIGEAGGAAPAPPPPAGLTPGEAVASKPDRHGLVTLLRAHVSRLARGDSLRIALHWATEKGPLRRDAYSGQFQRAETLRSMTFTIETPEGKKRTLQPAKKEIKAQSFGGFYYRPTFLLTLGNDGLTTEADQKIAWRTGMQSLFDKPGVYVLRISGALVGPKAEPIPFESAPLRIELGTRALEPLARIEEVARRALARKFPTATTKAKPIIIDDKKGNRLVRFRDLSGGGRWVYVDHTVSVRPDGTVGDISQRQVFTCVARGTLIETERGPRPIEDVRPGQRVWSYSTEKQQRLLATVRLVRAGWAEETLLFGGTLRVTPEHPLWAAETWKPAAEVGRTDLLLTARLKTVAAELPRRLSGHVEVFDLTVSGPRNFFAGGFLVHNKDRDYWPRVDDPWYDIWAAPESKKE